MFKKYRHERAIWFLMDFPFQIESIFSKNIDKIRFFREQNHYQFM